MISISISIYSLSMKKVSCMLNDASNKHTLTPINIHVNLYKYITYISELYRLSSFAAFDTTKSVDLQIEKY